MDAHAAAAGRINPAPMEKVGFIRQATYVKQFTRKHWI